MPIEIPEPLTESTQDEATIVADEYYGNRLYYNNSDSALYLGHLQPTGTVLLGIGTLLTGTSVHITKTEEGNSLLSATDAVIGTLLIPGIASIANNRVGTLICSSLSTSQANVHELTVDTITASTLSLVNGAVKTLTTDYLNTGVLMATSASLTNASGATASFQNMTINTLTNDAAIISSLSGNFLTYSSGSLLSLTSAMVASGTVNSLFINAGQLTTSALVVNATNAPTVSGSSPTFYVDTADNNLKSVSSAGTSTYAPGKFKGDLTVHNGITETRLPVGSANQLLVVDPTQTLGVRWGAAFGSEYFSVDNVLTNGQTTATIFQSFLSMSPTLLGGTYLVSSSCALSSNGNQARSAQVITVIDTSTVSNQTLLLSTTIGTVSIADFRSLNVPAGTHSVSLQYRNQTAGSTLTISAAKLLIYRAN